MEQDEDSFIISLVVGVVFNEIQKNPHIPFRKGLPSHTIVDQDFFQFEVKGISPQDFIIHGHLEGGPHHTPDAVNGTVALSF